MFDKVAVMNRYSSHINCTGYHFENLTRSIVVGFGAKLSLRADEHVLTSSYELPKGNFSIFDEC